jgi:copper resistance protein C
VCGQVESREERTLNLLNKAIVTAGVLLLSVLSVFPSALAHSDLISSDPVAGASLEEMPESFSLTFNEELISIDGESVNTLTLQGIDGNRYELLAPTVVGAVLSAELSAAEYPAETYLLSYRAVSADGHPITGEITFSTNSPTTIESEVAAPVTTSYIPEPVESSSNTLIYLLGGLLLVVGILFGVKRKRGLWQK